MSTLTRNWTEEKFRFVIKNLDKKTGLSGAELRIELTEHDDSIAAFCHNGDKAYFRFCVSRFNDPEFKELAAIETIRHEYAHYYTHAANLDEWIYDPRRLGGHEKSWEYACKMVEILPNRYYCSNYYKDKDISIQQAKSLVYAEDVEMIRVLDYIKRWNSLPMKKEELLSSTEKLKEKFPECEIYHELDMVEHFLYGKGIVVDTRPDIDGQRLLVMFNADRIEVVKACRIKKAA